MVCVYCLLLACSQFRLDLLVKNTPHYLLQFILQQNIKGHIQKSFATSTEKYFLLVYHQLVHIFKQILSCNANQQTMNPEQHSPSLSLRAPWNSNTVVGATTKCQGVQILVLWWQLLPKNRKIMCYNHLRIISLHQEITQHPPFRKQCCYTVVF